MGSRFIYLLDVGSYRPLVTKTLQVTLEHIKPSLIGFSISVSLITDVQMRRLNRKYRGKDRPTDVLSFSRLEAFQPEISEKEIGDVVIAKEVCRRQAEEQGVTFREELIRLVVHGTLHLFGYDHETSELEAKRMFRLQNKIIRELLRSDRGAQPSRRGKASPRR